MNSDKEETPGGYFFNEDFGKKVPKEEYLFPAYQRLVKENADLREALEDLIRTVCARCEYHHIDPIGSNGWGHKLENGKIVRCRLSESERTTIVRVKGACGKETNDES